MTDNFELTRRQALGSLGAIGLASTGAGLGTSAYFSDDEPVTNNTVRAGKLNLLVDYATDSHQGSAGDSTNSGTIDGNPGSYSYVIDDVKPGDTGTLAFCPKLVDNTGWLWVGSEDGVTDYENGQTDPESDVDATGGDPGDGNGELSDLLQVTVSYCEDVSISNGTVSATTIRELNNPDDYTLADLAKDLKSGFLLDGDASGSTMDPYPASPDSGTQTGPCLCIEWEVPTDVGNEIQTDSAKLDFTFAAIQERHNTDPVSPFVDLTVGQGSGFDYNTIQAAIDASDDGDVILVHSGTYEETLDVQDRTGLCILGDDGVTVRPTTTLQWGSETNFPGRTTAIRVVNAQDVTFQNLTFDFEGIDDTAITGVLFWESTGLVCENTLEGMSNPNDAVDLTTYLGTNDPGSSTFAASDRARIEFRNNEFVEVGRIGINVEDFVHAVVEGNTFETTDAGYAVEVGSEGTGVVRNNEISGFNTNFSDGSESAGIYVENAYPASGISGLVKDVVVAGNEVYDCTVGIRIGNEYDSITGDVDIEVTLSQNDVHDNDDGISVTDAGADVGSSVAVTASNNTVENNDNGYYIFESNDNSDPDDGDITVDAKLEDIADNDVGVLVESTSPTPVDSFQSVAVTDSNVEGNASDGVRNTVGNLTVDATDNWWGASDGPSGAGPGSGDGVSSNVDFTPFESSPVPGAGN